MNWKRIFLATSLVPILAAAPAVAVDPDPSQIQVELGVYGGGQGRFHPDQEIAFYAEAEKDCYLAVYNIDSNGKVSLLFPEDPTDSGWVEGGERYRVPERGSGYGLYLGSTPGNEFIVAVASENRLDLDRLFPDGRFTALGDIYADEGLDQDGLSEETWVVDDPFLAMDLIDKRIVPTDERGADNFGEAYLSLRVGDDDEGAGYSNAPSDVEQVTVVHHVYDTYWYDPFWDPWWDPWYGSGYYVRAAWGHPWGYYGVPYYGSWWGDPWCHGPASYVAFGWGYPYYWGPSYWSGFHSGVSVGFSYEWWNTPSYGYVSGGSTPVAYWGSQVKWKTLSNTAGFVGGSTVKWKSPTYALASATPTVGVRPPPVRMKMNTDPIKQAVAAQGPQKTRSSGKSAAGAGVAGPSHETRTPSEVKAPAQHAKARNADPARVEREKAAREKQSGSTARSKNLKQGSRAKQEASPERQKARDDARSSARVYKSRRNETRGLEARRNETRGLEARHAERRERDRLAYAERRPERGSRERVERAPERRMRESQARESQVRESRNDVRGRGSERGSVSRSGGGAPQGGERSKAAAPQRGNGGKGGGRRR